MTEEQKVEVENVGTPTPAKKDRKEYARKYYLANKEKIKAQVISWQKLHPEKVKQYQLARRERIKAQKVVAEGVKKE